jgi:hypothetical protein
MWINVDNIFKHVGKAEKFKCVDEIRPHRFGGEGVLIGGKQQH